MADEEANWLSEDVEETPAEEQPAAETAAAAAAGDAPAAAADAAPVEEEVLPPPPEPRDPNKPILCKHWIRPKFLNYKYIYDYRHNYYDDVIDYLDRRQKGLIREIPRAQEWAERAMRTAVGQRRSEAFKAKDRDIHLLSDIRTGAKFYNYHSNAYVHRRYAKYLYGAA